MGEARLKQSRADFSVGIGFPCGATVPWQTAMSLARTVHLLAVLGIPANIHVIAGSSDVVIARDVVLDNYLADAEKFMFWIDSDMSWRPEDFIRVLRLTKEWGLVSAAYPLKRDPPECIINFADTEPVVQPHGCVEILSTGLGFTCVRRDLIDAFAATKEKMMHDGNGRMIIDAFRRDKKLRADGLMHGAGEDACFFEDMRALGFKAWLDPTISLGHTGSKEYCMPMQDLTLSLPAVQAA